MIVGRRIGQFSNLRTPDTKILLPADLSDLDALLGSVGLRDRDA